MQRCSSADPGFEEDPTWGDGLLTFGIENLGTVDDLPITASSNASP
jgi:hypothetical protein